LLLQLTIDSSDRHGLRSSFFLLSSLRGRTIRIFNLDPASSSLSTLTYPFAPF
jgi:hypothetical protein